MALNTSHHPDGSGVLIYNGEMILLYIKEVNLTFDGANHPAFKSGKKGQLYLTSHRIIFRNGSTKDPMLSFCFPFHCLKNVKLEQPIFGANYLQGTVLAQPNGNWEGSVSFKLTFNKGGCIDFGRALLQATSLAERFRPYDAPPPYAPPASGFFCAPPAYYTPATNNYHGFAPPTDVFPDRPGNGNVYMYDSPPPYSGIGPDPPPYPAGSNSGPSMSNGVPHTGSPMASAPPMPPSYDEAVKKTN